jgi:hypothetical protein
MIKDCVNCFKGEKGAWKRHERAEGISRERKQLLFGISIQVLRKLNLSFIIQNRVKDTN